MNGLSLGHTRTLQFNDDVPNKLTLCVTCIDVPNELIAALTAPTDTRGLCVSVSAMC